MRKKLFCWVDLAQGGQLGFLEEISYKQKLVDTPHQ